VYYNFKPSSKAYDYVTEKNKPLFPFGFGLSYTSFFYSQPRFTNEPLSKGLRATVSVEITNTGTRAGEEIVQLYIHDKVSSVTRPVKELKAFQKIRLTPGETKSITFDITDEMLKFWNKDMKYLAEPGEFEIMIGPNSNELQKIIYTLK
jgi:beta-glucosidase